jgi:hypothetical protein
MKKMVFIIILLSILAACSSQNPTNPLSGQQTQVALFADATSTKGAAEAQVQMTLTAMAFTPSPTATRIPPTATPVPPTATPAPTEVAPTSEPSPTTVPTTAPTSVPVTDPSQISRIQFAWGTTNLTTEGSLVANSTKRYVFWADQNQYMEISLQGRSGTYIALYTPSGQQLINFDQKLNSYRGYVTERGDWYIDIKTGDFDTNFSLYLGITQNLYFAYGTYGMDAWAALPAGMTHNFLAWAMEGQTISLSVSPKDNFTLSIQHVNGTVLVSKAEMLTSFEGVLPETGDYMIDVVSAASSPTTITLGIYIK